MAQDPTSPRTPAGPGQAPDAASAFGREDPAKEAGMGRLDNDPATPTPRPDQPAEAVPNRRPPRQVNADDAPDRQARQPLSPGEPDHSMYEEEPAGEELAPEDIHRPRDKRHPRKEGKGGTP